MANVATNFATLVARLVADPSGFRVGLNSARNDLAQFRASAQGVSRDAQAAFSGIGAAWRSTAAVMASVGVTLGLGALVREASDFQRQMLLIKATAGASSDQMRALETTVRRTGLSLRVGANNAAFAAYEMQKAGVSIEDLNAGALEASETLAQATGGSFSESAQIAASAMQVFHKNAADLDDVVQGVTGTVLGGRFELNDYALALQQGGGAAHSAGLSLDDFNTALLLVQHNLGSSGSDTGTALRTFLARLTPTSNEAAQAMKNLGLDFYDAQGRFIGLANSAQMIHDKFKDLTDEARNANFYQIFGVDAARVAQSLYNEGAEGVDHYRAAVNEAANAHDIAIAKTDGFAGAIDNLKASFTELGVVISHSQVMDFISAVTNWAAGGVQHFATGVEALGGGSDRRGSIFQMSLADILSTGQNDPAIRALSNEGRRRSGNYFGTSGGWGTRDTGLDDALRLMSPQDIVAFLQSHNVQGRAPWQDGVLLSDTFAGRRIVEIARRAQGAPPAGVQYGPGAVYAGEETPKAGGTNLLPPLTNTQWDQRAWLQQVDEFLQGMRKTGESKSADAARALKEGLGELKLGKLDVDVEGLITREDQIKAIGVDFAENVIGSVEDAFVSSDFSSFEDNLNRAWKQALYEALFADDVRAFVTAGATALRNILWQAFGGGSNNGGGGWLSTIVGLFGGTGGGSAADAMVGASYAGAFADGGFIPPGQWGWTGEEGPEPVFGGMTGASVVPAGAADAAQRVVEMHVTVDVAGATGNEEVARIARVAAEAGARQAIATVSRTFNEIEENAKFRR